jgi:polyphosphate kinase
MTDEQEERAVELEIGGAKRRFDIDDPILPDWVKTLQEQSAVGQPDKLGRSDYDRDLELLQVELVKVQAWQQKTGNRVVVLFEGRDAAGKGGAIAATREYMNPRSARIVALPKPTERERGQWYYQRYVEHLPSAGEFVMFDRSWYNRAGVEPVMGFCTPDEHAHFLAETPDFERMLVKSGIYLFKFWLDIGRAKQLERFHDRRHTILKAWKLSPMDIASIQRWDDYTAMRDRMFASTHTDLAPWIVVRADDKRRARLNLIRRVLLGLPYEGKNINAIGHEEPAIIGGPELAVQA